MIREFQCSVSAVAEDIIIGSGDVNLYMGSGCPDRLPKTCPHTGFRPQASHARPNVTLYCPVLFLEALSLIAFVENPGPRGS